MDEGLVTLDDPEVVEKYCPELKDLPILESIDENGKESTRPKKNRITLRMLLAHTAGKFPSDPVALTERILLIAQASLTPSPRPSTSRTSRLTSTRVSSSPA